MNQQPVDRLFDSSSYQDDLYASALGWETPELFIIKRAIVISVKLGINTNDQTVAMLPQYSINARIIGEDIGTDLPENNIPDWFLPLISNSIVSIPEIGEQILIIRETTRIESKGYWIGRVNDTDKITLKLANQQLIDGNPLPQQRYGMPFNVSDLNARSRQPNSYADREVFELPGKLGDLIMQGRSGTFIRHSYNPQNGKNSKPGVLELGILENRDYGQLPLATIGNTKTKTIHLSDTNPSALGPAMRKRTPNADDYIVDIAQATRSGSTIYQSETIETPKNIIVNMANELYNISDAPESEALMHRQVLGEKLTDYLTNHNAMIRNLISVVRSFSETVEQIVESYINHVHTIPEININIPDKEISIDDHINLGIELQAQPPLKVFIPGQVINIPATGGETVETIVQTPYGARTYIETVGGSPGATVAIPSKFVGIPQPDKAVNRGYRTVKRTRKIEYDKISIGGAANPRNTTTIETNSLTDKVQDQLVTLEDDFRNQMEAFNFVTTRLGEVLSERNFLN